MDAPDGTPVTAAWLPAWATMVRFVWTTLPPVMTYTKLLVPSFWMAVMGPSVAVASVTL